MGAIAPNFGCGLLYYIYHNDLAHLLCAIQSDFSRGRPRCKQLLDCSNAEGRRGQSRFHQLFNRPFWGHKRDNGLNGLFHPFLLEHIVEAFLAQFSCDFFSEFVGKLAGGPHSFISHATTLLLSVVLNVFVPVYLQPKSAARKIDIPPGRKSTGGYRTGLVFLNNIAVSEK